MPFLAKISASVRLDGPIAMTASFSFAGMQPDGGGFALHPGIRAHLKFKCATQVLAPRDDVPGTLFSTMSSKPVLIATLSLFFIMVAPAFAAGAREVPVPVRTVAPAYPPALRAKGVSGLVLVKCSIDVQGNVIDASVSKSSNPDFNPLAVEAIRKWKFKPARQDGSAIAVEVTIPIKFDAGEASS
jgi:protein TonB